MEHSTDPPGKVTENAVNMAAAAAMNTTAPAPTNDDTTAPSNDDGSAWVLVQKKRRAEANLSVSQPKHGNKTRELQGDTTYWGLVSSRFNSGREIQVTVSVQAAVTEQDLLSFSLQDALTTTTCKASGHFGGRCTPADEPVFSPVDRR
ncbi:hypothetical protein MRX96_052647 [Rhipicephalus microplus]